MTLRLLFDECLSPELVEMAVAAGYVESTCVRDRGWSGTKDWKLIEPAVAGDYTLVTHNAVDFRGIGSRRPGGQHERGRCGNRWGHKNDRDRNKQPYTNHPPRSPGGQASESVESCRHRSPSMIRAVALCAELGPIVNTAPVSRISPEAGSLRPVGGGAPPPFG